MFASAHFITFAGHRCEGLHGHNYRGPGDHREARSTKRAGSSTTSWRSSGMMRGLCDGIDTRCCCRCDNPKIQVVRRRVELGEGGWRGNVPRYVFPSKDCAMLPVTNTTVEMLAEMLAGQLRGELRGSEGARASPPSRWKSRRTSARRLRLSREACRRAAPPGPGQCSRLGREAAGSCSAVATSAPSAAGVGQPLAKSSGPRTPPPARQTDLGHRGAAGLDRLHVRAGAGADARQLQHDHRRHAGGGRRRSTIVSGRRAARQWG